ncbi:putative chloroquine-resistance transporter [Helianthus annuus]|uniref:Chloroquine-resistance transporter n=1 Tax=Helianthus annuus TaxID=4232 RepID=A0A251UJ89_HELAN|nr:protein CLT1, chloroplastic isoform X2 [Helianthus annuus]KAF5803471.1 putative chloroquine-resistance transporter [Helianthus annuus]KAJ0561415.1 putative chloroquine-resistance transporter [Helianthus annuus]KAJ0568052.1 putative chloroquine-resistance transporter [Helianthus annuus]KAJ0574473.1 putative chloroquine-resistance transporter [Helianthus annuus]KAJ0738806.1 putative chloroquine-resistance transporter [Helianthus annuus]
MAASTHRILSSSSSNFPRQSIRNRRLLSSESQFLPYPTANQPKPQPILLRQWTRQRKLSSTICWYALHDNKEEEDEEQEEQVAEIVNYDCQRRRRAEVAVAAVATMGLGVGNRVLYKLALVPLKQYPFFLAQLATFGYVVVYFCILHFRHRAGIVTDEMLSIPKAPLLAVGLVEAISAACGMAAGAVLSGAAIPILSQSFLVWQIILSYLFLGRRYKFNQLLGCFLVAVGVVVTVASGSSAGSLMEAGLFWSLLMIVSFLFQAADTILKEVIFLDAAKKLKGGSVDLFVINSYGSAFQAIFICLLLPFLSRLWGIPFRQLPNYLSDGAACFLNMGTISSGCEGAPLLPVLFCMVNMGYNISLLHLIKISSGVVSSLASTVSVPISVFVFTLPLPYLGVASSLPSGFIAGAVVLVMGMLIYAWTPSTSTPPPIPSPVTTSSL